MTINDDLSELVYEMLMPIKLHGTYLHDSSIAYAISRIEKNPQYKNVRSLEWYTKSWEPIIGKYDWTTTQNNKSKKLFTKRITFELPQCLFLDLRKQRTVTWWWLIIGVTLELWRSASSFQWSTWNIWLDCLGSSVELASSCEILWCIRWLGLLIWLLEASLCISHSCHWVRKYCWAIQNV